MNVAVSMTEENPASVPAVPASSPDPAPAEIDRKPGKEGSPAASPATPPDPSTLAVEWESRFKYLFADFENYRKRTERERDSIRRRAEADVLRNLLPIQDAFERAREFIRHAPRSDPVRKGFDLLGHEWDAFLKREGIEPVAKPGNRFDPDENEVVGEGPVSSGHPVDTVVEVVQQGYRFQGGLLRPAKVIVARPRRAAPPEEGSPSAHSPGAPPAEPSE